MSSSIHSFGGTEANPLLSSLQCTKFDKAFSKFPKKEMYRMFIDHNRQNEGENTFDVKEPGYKCAMLKAFDYISKTIGKKVDADEFVLIHDLCVENVFQENGNSFDKGLRRGAWYGLEETTERKISYETKKEWESEKLILTEKRADEILDEYDEDEYDRITDQYLRKLTSDGMLVDTPKRTIAAVVERINKVLHEYYDQLEKANIPEEKIASIAKLCRALEIMHVFNDGNQRTIVFVLLNKLLIENDLSPTILQDPYVFDGYCSVNELVSAIKIGQSIFRSHCRKD